MAGIVGRERELERLAAGLDAGVAGTGGFFLVAGEAGIGKTALARAIEDLAGARGFAVARARGWDGEGAPAYWPFIQVFRTLLQDHGSSPRAAKVAELVPELGDGAGAGSTSRASSDAGRRFALFDAAAGWLRDVAQGTPLLLVLEDLHAADPSSLSMLNFVARELRRTRLVIVGTYRERDGARGPDVEGELVKLVREATLLRLERLERDAVAKMIEDAKGSLPAPIVDLVFRTSEGVPLFVEEILRAMSLPGAAWMTSAPLPAGVRGALRDRLARLDAETRRILETASVIGRSFTLALLSLLVPEAAAYELVERAARADVLERPAPGRYAFAHPLIREALYRDIAGGPRAKLHAAILDALETGKAESTLAERAYHALRAAPVIGVERAVGTAREAADAAMKVHAFEDAAELLRRSLAVLDVAPASEDVRASVLAALTRARARAQGEDAVVAAASAPATSLELRCEGELWCVTLDGKTVRSKDSRGMRMLAQLVERPGEEVHALTLSAAPSEDAVPAGDSGEVLDREAIAAYRERLVEVEEELREAEGWNDAARIESARAEAEFLRTELSRAVGLGGRSRKAGADAERARVNCQRRIRDAIRRVAEQDETIGKHLLRAVRTGTFCVYEPERAR